MATATRRAAIGLAVLTLALTLFFSGGRTLNGAAEPDAYENIEVFTNILSIVQKNYVDEITTEKLIEGAIGGMLNSLDPHSAYLTPELYRELQVDTKGRFGGLGIEITIRDGVLTVVSPIEDTPAFRAGIKPADQIIKIEDEFTKDMSLLDAVRRMRGPKGTKITISIRREGVPSLIDVTLVREIIRIQSVKYRTLEPHYAYLRIAQFQEGTDDDVAAAIDALIKDNGRLEGLVIDLRNNPGGLLTQAVKVADLFLDSGVVVYTEGRLDTQKQKYFAHKRGTYDSVPTIVLVNGGSASASEIVAGALQDHGRALVLGTKTFGKGSVQTILPLDDKSALRLTTARYFTPKGRDIQVDGIEPDIPMDNAAVVARAERPPGHPSIREENLPGHLPSEPQGEGGDEEVEEGELGRDPQLDHALELLKSWRVFRTVLTQRE